VGTVTRRRAERVTVNRPWVPDLFRPSIVDRMQQPQPSKVRPHSSPWYESVPGKDTVTEEPGAFNGASTVVEPSGRGDPGASVNDLYRIRAGASSFP
jgi:hypothetical protein